jgi:negative regulator of flagellin synthesis FlgM
MESYMTDPVNTQIRARTSNSASGQSTTSNGSTEQSARSSEGNSSAAVIVELSSSTLVKNLDAEIKNTPEINQEKIDSIKQALKNGEYTPNIDVIAEKFAEIESLLP